MTRKEIIRDPRDAALAPCLRRPGLKLGLGVDLGTTCGIAYSWFDPDKPLPRGAAGLWAGQIDLSVGDWESGALRFVRLRSCLEAINPDIVFFEDVKFVGTNETYRGPRSITMVLARAARPIELFGAFKETLCTWCEYRKIPCAGFTIQAIKKRATGLGNAGKPAVIAAANAEFGLGLEIEGYDKLGTDNVADATYCLMLGLEQYSRGLPGLGESDSNLEKRVSES